MDRVQEYVETHQLQTRDANDVIEEFGDEIAKMKGKCLDIGCGPAAVTRKLFMPKLPAEATVVGSDISKTMIDYARTTNADEDRLSFVELNIEADSLPSDQIEAYDNAVSFYCLHWCQNMRKVLDNMYQLLRPGGKSLVLFLAHNTGFDSYLKISNDPKYKPYMKDVSKYIPHFQNNVNPRATLKKYLEEAGFKVLHCSFREKTFVYNEQTLKKHVIAVNPFINRIPVEVREQFEEDLLREIISRKISFGNTDNGSKGEFKVLDRYHVLIASFEKPKN